MAAQDRLKTIARRAQENCDLVFSRAEHVAETCGRDSREADVEWRKAGYLFDALSTLPQLVGVARAARTLINAPELTDGPGDTPPAARKLAQALDALDAKVTELSKEDS